MLAYLLLTLLCSAPLPPPQTLWEFEAGGVLSAPLAFYPSVEKPQSVVAVTISGKVTLIDPQGKPVWQHDLGSETQATPAIGDLDGDGAAELVFATSAGRVVVLDAKGQERWRFQLAGSVIEWRAPCLADLDGDSKPEVLVSDGVGWMTCLSNDGRRLWRITIDPYRASSPAVADVNGDGKPEVIFGTENDRMVCIDNQGQLVWISRNVGQFGRTAPTLGDIDGDGLYEVVFQTSFNTPKSRLIVLNAEDGNLAWEAPLTLQGYAAIAIADLNNDGQLEVFVGERSNTIYCFNGDGTKRWATNTGGHAYFWPVAVADVTGDDHCEILGSVRETNERGNSWFVLDDQGNLLAEYPIPGGMPGMPLVADLDGDSRTEVVLYGAEANFPSASGETKGHKSGIVRCVTFGGKATGARRAWGAPRFDAARTGTVPITNAKSTPASTKTHTALDVTLPSSLTWGENCLGVRLPDAVPEGALLEISVVDTEGRRTTRLKTLEPQIAQTELPLDIIGQGRQHVSVRVVRGDKAGILATWQGTVDVPGFDALESFVLQRLGELRARSSTLLATAPGSAQFLGERAARESAAFDVLKARAAQLSLHDVHSADHMLDDVADYVHQLAATAKLAELTTQAQTIHTDQPLAVWEDTNPWDEIPSWFESPTIGTQTTIAVPLFDGEYESRAIHLVNLSPEPLTAQIRPDEAMQAAIKFYEIIESPRRDGTWVPDALSEMNDARTVHLAPGEVRTVWLTLNGNVLKPGITELKADILPLGHDDCMLGLVMHADVSPLSLHDAPLFRVCNWWSPARIRKAGLPEREAMADTLAHGVNVFTLGLPHRTVDAEGNLVGEPKWKELDDDLDLMGSQSFALFGGEGVTPPAGTERFGPLHLKAQRAFLTEFAAHMKAKGWDYDRWALYPVDEPGVTGETRIVFLRDIATHFKLALPGVPIYTDPSGGVTTTNFADLLDKIDVWCPEQQLLRRQPELATYFLKTGNPVWSYEAPGEVKSLHPLGYYRANPWMAFQLGLSGVGFWIQAYEEDNDLWRVKDTYEWGALYTAGGRDTISRRWEAWRDGIEDARMFIRLRDVTDAARKTGVHADLVAQADKLLKEDVKAATQNAWDTNDITRMLRPYDMDYTEIGRIRMETKKLLSGLLK